MKLSTLQFNNASLNTLLESQRDLQRVQIQLATGKQYNTFDENPVETTRIHSLEVFSQRLDLLSENTTFAVNRLSATETSLSSISNVLQRVRELKVQATSGILNNADRNVIAIEMEQRLQELVGLVNTKDSAGQFIFSGFSSQIQTYLFNGTDYIYQGDSGQRFLDVGLSTSVAINDSGFNVFENVPNGNGTFVTSDGGGANTGTGIISTGTVSNATAFVPDTYTITFVTNSSGNLAYQVIGANSGQLIPALPAAIPADAPDYAAGSNISFNGVNLEITGTPAVGDTFQVEPSTSQNMLTSVNNLVTALRTSINNENEFASFVNTIDRNTVAIEQAANRVNDVIASIGARLNVIESESQTLEDFNLQNEQVLAGIRDTDIVSASTEFTQKMSQYEAAQNIFVRLSSLSLLSIVFGR